MATDIRRAMKKMIPHLVKAKEENLNEADTVLRIIKVFEVVLGWDGMSEITRESAIKDRYVDIALKYDGTIRLLVEVKAAGIALRDRHIEQAEHYAAQGNYSWVLLTNGIEWALFHLTFDDGIESVKVFSANIESADIDKTCSMMSLLHRNSIRNDELDNFWTQKVALSPESIAKALFTQDALMYIRRNLRKREGVLIDPEELAEAIHDMLSVEARERIGPLKLHKKRKTKSSHPEQASNDAPASSEINNNDSELETEVDAK